MAQAPRVFIDSDVLRQIRQHARSCPKSEVCGILIGTEKDRQVAVQACIAGLNATQGGAHVTFTQDTWEHIYQIKDAKYPVHRMVGWYHSHPGFGVFLSEHDSFIHQNFFSAALQIAWVYDPDSDEEGCYGWVGKRLERLSEISITDGKGGEGAGESGKTEPVMFGQEVHARDEEELRPDSAPDAAEPLPAWFRWPVMILSYLAVAAVGFALSWFVFPRPIAVPFLLDSQTGRIVGYIDPRTGDTVMNKPAPFDIDPGKLKPPAGIPSASPAPATPFVPGPASVKDKHAQQ